MLHVHPSCSPAGVQEEPLPPQQHGVPQMIRFHILEALALPVPDALAVARHLLALDAHLSVNTQQTCCRLFSCSLPLGFGCRPSAATSSDLTCTSPYRGWSSRSTRRSRPLSPPPAPSASRSGPGSLSRRTLGRNTTVPLSRRANVPRRQRLGAYLPMLWHSHTQIARSFSSSLLAPFVIFCTIAFTS